MLAEADTLDFLVMDVALSYTKYTQDRAEARRKGQAPPAPDIPLNTLQDMIERVKR